VKCSNCGLPFAPARAKAKQRDEEDEDDIPKKKKRVQDDEDDVDDEDEAPKKKKKKRKQEDDEDEENEDVDDEDEDEEPRKKKKKKKKKAGASSALYWAYRGCSIVVLLGLVGVLIVVLVFWRGRPTLRQESTVDVEMGVSSFSFVDAISSNQNVKVTATAGGEFNIYVFLQKDKAAIENELVGGKTPAKVLASKTKTSEATLSAPIPANEQAVVMVTSAGKKVEVKLKITN
jgi:cytoskeletal protein RodZ